MKDVTLVADVFRAIGHPVRLKILDTLGAGGEACVCHLEATLGLRQAYLSQHLARLREAGLVIDRREGLNVYYRLASPVIADILAAAVGLDAAMDVGEPTRRRHLSVLSTEQRACTCPRCLKVATRGAGLSPAVP